MTLSPEEELIARLKRRLWGEMVDVRQGLAGEIREAIKMIENKAMSYKVLNEKQVELLRELDCLHALVAPDERTIRTTSTPEHVQPMDLHPVGSGE